MELELPSWGYLARRKIKELSPKVDKLEQKSIPALAWLDAYLDEVTKLAISRPAVAQAACLNVIDLYAKDNDPDVAERLTRFKNLAKAD